MLREGAFYLIQSHPCSEVIVLVRFIGRLTFIHLQCWEVLPFCRFQRQRCIKILCPKDPEFYTPLALKTAKGQHLPALVVYKNQSPIYPGKSHPWTNTSVGGNFRRTFRTIWSIRISPGKVVWTNDWSIWISLPKLVWTKWRSKLSESFSLDRCWSIECSSLLSRDRKTRLRLLSRPFYHAIAFCSFEVTL